MSGYTQRADLQMGLQSDPPLREGEILKVFGGKIHRQNEQGSWYQYAPANFRPLLR